ncbi:tRNA (N(6)-L-threonylcarbamoyladenosine(37)-C(2))-methylthiotransferase [Candidatus Woesearchaeota archaeon]|nr:tRNA (N(6)-L-threonylcarbamoyladenosine(37)-C(2))-methylthiotransferase [Candidatus Woesearchaeota archaeon]
MKVFIKTFGCELNRADSEVIAGLLDKEGFKLVSSLKESDVVIVNSCGVKLPTQNKVLEYIKKVPKNKRVVVGGCLPKMLNVKIYCPNVDLVFDTNSITKIAQLIKQNKSLLSDEKEDRISLPVVRIRKEVAIIPIAQGCLGSPCAYCSVKKARGDLKSYKKEDILKQVDKAVKEGCVKIRLTAQDTGCWGKDFGQKLPHLLKSVLAVEGGFEVRLGMTNPNYALEYLGELVDIYKSPKMKKFLHIPVQSGSDKVLQEMERKYSVQDFEKVVKKFRKDVPEICIATDIIVGFPTETGDDFKKTLDLVKKIKPEVLNISKFGMRPGTLAANMKQLPSQEIKRRSVILHKLFRSLQKHE